MFKNIISPTRQHKNGWNPGSSSNTLHTLANAAQSAAVPVVIDSDDNSEHIKRRPRIFQSM